jgi:hypothetical protein
MVKGLDGTKIKKRPWKTRMERDIMLHKDIKEAYLHKGKAYGEITHRMLHKKKILFHNFLS